MDPRWYLRRLSRMSPLEVAQRAATSVRIRRWRSLVDVPPDSGDWLPARRFTAVLPSGATASVHDDARANLVATADRLMAGYAEYFGVAREDMVAPDWSLDPRTRRRAPDRLYSFGIPYRDEQAVGDIKQLWEPSRHQHLTVLAAAHALTGDERYAERVAEHLKSWWAANPPLRGVHWISGIELGIRLVSWVWVRRLLDGWAGAADLFENNPEAMHQILHHQRWLAAFPSRGSSANNHVIAELAGQLAASCAFAWFPESAQWRRTALRSLDEQLRRNTFPSGLNRELASEYHGLVLELGLAAIVEADVAGLAVPESVRLVLLRMTDALAAVVDVRLRPPRQGDADDGYGLVLDGAAEDRWASLLATGDRLFGRLGWWPQTRGGDVRTSLLAALSPARRTRVARPPSRPVQLADAGMTILRAAEQDGEIWCRCDGGPHGFLSIAAHAHADALSLEVRHDGIDILADPGTYCYHGESEWRSYFRSTLGHNTLELDGADQSVSAGPFLWTRHAKSRVLLAPGRPGDESRWRAEHAGYSRVRDGVVHRRTVDLTGPSTLGVADEVRSSRPRRVRLAYHLGPAVTAELRGALAVLRWESRGHRKCAEIELPPGLTWTSHQGELDPPLGWYSPRFGRRVPAVTLLGTGTTGSGSTTYVTRIGFGR